MAESKIGPVGGKKLTSPFDLLTQIWSRQTVENFSLAVTFEKLCEVVDVAGKLTSCEEGSFGGFEVLNINR